jgi:flagella basal body P-ring formation protein FlgA
MTVFLQALFFVLTLLAAWQSHAADPVTIIVRPAVELMSADGLSRELSLAELVDLKAVRKSDRAEIERHLRQIGLTDRPAIGEERLFTQEGLEPIVAEAERRLAAAGFRSEWKVPRRARVVRQSKFSFQEIEKTLRTELQNKCEDCEIRIGAIEVPVEAKRWAVNDWAIQSRNERPRGSFAWPLQVQLSDGTRRSLMVTGTVEYFRTVPVLTRAIQGGEKIGSVDRRLERRNITFSLDEPASDSELDRGVAARNMAAGESLWRASLRKEQVVRYGDIVRVQAGSEMFTVSTEGVALSAAALGDPIQVRVGKLQKKVSGILKEKGLVEIR